MSKAELARLEAILKSFPTTEAEDAKLMEGMHVSTYCMACTWRV